MDKINLMDKIEAKKMVDNIIKFLNNERYDTIINGLLNLNSLIIQTWKNKNPKRWQQFKEGISQKLDSIINGLKLKGILV